MSHQEAYITGNPAVDAIPVPPVYCCQCGRLLVPAGTFETIEYQGEIWLKLAGSELLLSINPGKCHFCGHPFRRNPVKVKRQMV